MTECNGDCTPCVQPYGREILGADGLFIKQMIIEKRGTMVPQHSHKYDHTTLVAVGAVEVWQEDSCLGTKIAPDSVFIPAGVKHTFVSLADNSILYCIHHLHETEYPEVLEEHQLRSK